MKNFNFGYLLFLSIIAAMGGFLFGYDEAVISGTISDVSTQFALDKMAEGWFVGSALVGAIIGVLFAGALGDKAGRKNTMIISAVLFCVSMIGCALSGSFTELVTYRIVGGVGIGVASIVCPLYISEISVAQHRGLLVSLYQLAVTIGVVGAYIMNNYLLVYSQSGAELTGMLNTVFVSEVWRGMLGMGFLPSFIFLVAVLFIPESPRWLITRDKLSSAEAIFSRIYTDPAEIQRQIAATREVCDTKESSEIKLLFQPGIFTALIIGVCIAILGQFMGVNAVLYYGPEIFKSAGLPSDDALFYQVLVGLANMLTTVLAMFIIDKVGRKSLVYYGVSGMIISLLLIAFYFVWGASLGLSSVFLLVFFMLYIICCAGSICAVVWVILSEMYPIKVRAMAMSVAGLSLWIGTYLIGQLTPWLLANITPAGTFLLFAVMCVPYMLIMWKLVPETTGKSLEEIEKYWTKK
ncbi:MAG: sugar porter family MFS transporter [Muribaculaceae bacterium]|nr:sugar porter family MFS transporter [Muribaculaceae bacterium]MDY5118480.1 sugar porter family MFS transporter [Muribaculaceae bacterium]